mmetsp:Transcript_21492/g.50898  ORF Transcript_21492/g.50898 Transcript_21492/m.50898 type:complete len:504 (-) Transcript_21492:2954-4465(-)
MLLQLIETVQNLLNRSVQGVLTVLIYIAIVVAVANHVGWLDRWIWFILEKEAKKIMNGAQLTIGSFTIDWSEVLQGQITLHASNVIIHTPQRDEWQWDSPLIARVGKATVQCNAIITVFHVVFLRREIPIEAYTVIVADAQVFVERRNSVINVYLLNPMLKLPPPPYPKKTGSSWKGLGRNKKESPEFDGEQKKVGANGEDLGRTGPETQASGALARSNNLPETSTNGGEGSTRNAAGDGASARQQNHDQKAKALVNEMLQAVQVLGGAAARGKLPGAIKQQGLELVGRLQGFREQENLEEGLRVMQQMGKVAVESLQTAPQLILPKPDAEREGMKKIVYVRIGRIVANDIRIFTKDSWINATNTQDDFVDSTSGSAIGTQTNIGTNRMPGNSTSSDTSGNKNGSWNKPIFIERLVLRSSELCPPMSMKDRNGLPAIYQSVDKVVEVIWRRLLAEIAKSNTGKLFSTAMGEVVSVMVSNPPNLESLPPTRSTASSDRVNTAYT